MSIEFASPEPALPVPPRPEQPKPITAADRELRRRVRADLMAALLEAVEVLGEQRTRIMLDCTLQVVGDSEVPS